jgi:hypothetical protein
MVLNLNEQDYNIVAIECFNTNVTKIEVDNLLKNIDIIIMQPIQDNYREKEYLSSKYMINNSKNTCKIILFDNCYFNFYHFDTTLHPFINNNDINNNDINNNDINNNDNDSKNKLLWEPCLYHYTSLVDCHKHSSSKDLYIKNYVNNYFLKNEKELTLIAENGINELIKRNNNMLVYKNSYPKKFIECISIAKFVRDNYKKKLLFYTINHPSKIILQFIAINIISILKIPNSINYNIDPLNYIKCIIYKCINRCVYFNVNNNNYKPFLNGESDIDKIIDLYLNVYNSNTYLQLNNK